MVEAATAGTIALWGAIGVLVISSVTPRRVTARLLWLAVGLAWSAVAVLLIALLGNDFTLEYVVRTTSRATPWPYRLSALWGGMEGSLLFYAALVLGIGVYGVRRHGRTEQTVVSVVALGFLLLTALGANPFRRLDIPAVDGEGLLAILQHPAMIYHPPILYFGLTTLVVPFALTVGWAARFARRTPLDQPSADRSPLAGGTHPGSPHAPLDVSPCLAGGVPERSEGEGVLGQVRRWLMWSWMWLAVGMAAGANWAYIELGWGGFWAWDPVENTALMPWLAVTVFLHTSRVYQRDGRLRRWTLFFAMFPFALSVLGVYLTRSGVTGSIHAFAEDPVIGKVLLTAALVVTAFVVAMIALASRGTDWSRIGSGRDTWLLASTALVAIALVFILVGSAYPAFLAVFWDSTVVVGPSFFVTTVLPVALVIALLIGFALNTTWVKTTAGRSDLVLYIVSSAVAATLATVFAIEIAVPGIILVALAAGGVALLVRDLFTKRHHRRYLPSLLAHLGLTVILLAAGASALGTEFNGHMSVGDVVAVGPYDIVLVEINLGEGDRFVYAEGVFRIDDRIEMRPQIRGYERQRLPVAEPALRSTPLADVILAVTRFDPVTDGFEVSFFVRPMVWWVWFGAVVVSLAGALALRDGVSSGRRQAARREPQPAGTTT